MYGMGWAVVCLRNFHVGVEPRKFDETVPLTRTNSRVFGLVSSIFTLGGAEFAFVVHLGVIKL